MRKITWADSLCYSSNSLKGYRVGIVELPFVSSASVGFFIPAGSAHETSVPNGTAHFLEHMLFKGTSKYSARTLAESIESAGCLANAYTAEDHTQLEIRGPAEQLEHMIELCCEMLWNSNIDEKEIERERSVIEEEIIGYQESPSEHIFDLASHALWGDSALGRSITGTEQSIQKITRSSLFSFQQTHYRQAGISIGIAGNIERSKALDQLEMRLPQVINNRRPLEKFKPQFKTVRQENDVEQCHYCLSIPTVGLHDPRKHSLRLLSLLIGETMSSRLFQRLREELGLCYSIYSDYNLFEKQGMFNVYAAIDQDRFEQAKEEIHLSLKEFCQTPLSETELRAAQRYALSQIDLSLESSQAFMQWLGDALLYHDTIIGPLEIKDELEKVTVEDITGLASELFLESSMATAEIVPS
jgi:predicted Zn-dependent peptidase